GSRRVHGMRPFGALLGADEAKAKLLGAARRVQRVEDAPLDAAWGRVAAEDLASPLDVPGFARSTMDGYAVRSADAGPRRVVGEIPAGATVLPKLGPGEAARIATGAPLPPGADAVVRVEDAREDGSFRVAPKPGQFVDAAGSDLARGAPVLRAGDVLTPARLGLVASVGLARVRMLAKPRVALFSSGDELLSPGKEAQPLRIFDSNTITLRALLAQIGRA